MADIVRDLDPIADAAAIRDHALRALRDWSSVSVDRDDIANDTWILYREWRERGGVARNGPALIASIARHQAEKVKRRRQATVADVDGAREPAAPEASGPDARYDIKISLLNGAVALHALSTEERDAYRLSHQGCSAEDAIERLGCSRATYFRRARSAHEQVSRALIGESSDVARDKLELVSLYLATAEALTRAERQLAETLIDTEPHIAVLAREAHERHEQLAATLPPLAAALETDAELPTRALGALGKVREQFAATFGRASESAQSATETVASAGGTRGGGTAVGGGLAALLGGGGAKIAGVCTAGAAVACVSAIGVLPASIDPLHKRAQADRPAPAKQQEKRQAPPARASAPAPAAEPAPAPPPPPAAPAPPPEPEPQPAPVATAPPPDDPSGKGAVCDFGFEC